MRQAAEHWVEYSVEFTRDGSLRDIYVFNASLKDWSKVAAYLAERYPLTFRGGWQGHAFPKDIACLFPISPVSYTTTLTIDLGTLKLNCHFFSEDELEFDLDPSDVREPHDLEAIFSFMNGLADYLGRCVLLKPENMPEIPIFEADGTERPVKHTPFGGFA